MVEKKEQVQSYHRLSLGEMDNGEIDCLVCGKKLSSSFYYICSDGDCKN